MATDVKAPSAASRAAVAVSLSLGIALSAAPLAAADPADDAAPGNPVSVAPVTADGADPAAVSACGQFADVLNATSQYYGEFADEFESYVAPNYNDPAINATAENSRTALRQGAGASMTLSNTPGLSPDIANPMRSWSFGATKLLVKMAVRNGGESLNNTATEMNTNAESVQKACAAAGTHA